MKNLLNRIIQLNIELEGALRVAADRPSEEALDTAKRKFAEISALFAMLSPAQYFASQEEDITEIKYEEAEGAETEPLEEPDLKGGDRALEHLEEIDEEGAVSPEIENAEEKQPEETQSGEENPHKEATGPSGPTLTPPSLPKDIRKLFTLNDKFLFKRELFGNNDEEFNATLDVLSSMKDFEEAREYAFVDLGWDETDKRVREFMAIVENYYS